MNAYYNESDIRSRSLSDKTSDALCALISVLTNKKLVSLVKICIISISLFAFIATVGMVNDGRVGFFMGTLICGTLSLLEISVIKSMNEKRKNK